MPRIEELKVRITIYENDQELPQNDLILLNEARKSSASAYAPYSNFWVGAALKLESGEVILGNNQENAAYPSGLCAERTAVYWLGANRPDAKIQCVAVTARKANTDTFLPVTPCGACRQALSEYENKQKQPIKVILEGQNGEIWVVPSIESLLPLKFSDDSLMLE